MKLFIGVLCIILQFIAITYLISRQNKAANTKRKNSDSAIKQAIQEKCAAYLINIFLATITYIILSELGSPGMSILFALIIFLGFLFTVPFEIFMLSVGKTKE